MKYTVTRSSKHFATSASMINDDVARLPPREIQLARGLTLRLGVRGGGSHATDRNAWPNMLQHHRGVGRVHPRARTGTVEVVEAAVMVSAVAATADRVATAMASTAAIVAAAAAAMADRVGTARYASGAY